MILMALQKSTPAPRPFPHPEASTPLQPEARQRVFLPPAEVLRQIAREAQPPPTPRALPTPPPDTSKERISIGAPSPVRQREPLILRHDQDLSQTRKGRPEDRQVAEEEAAQARQSRSSAESARAQQQPPSALRLPPGGDLPLPRDTPRRAASEPSIASSLRSLDERLQRSGRLGAPSGTEQQLGALLFDPEGADFTRWAEQFTTEVYRNWILPQPALMGLRGHVEIEFTVARDGRITALRVVRPSGMAAFDRAAQNALTAGRFLELPADFRSPSVTIRVTFYYNEPPQGA